MELLLILAAMYWLAAPDPVTAGARTAAGGGVRAAGTGVGRHWAAGRKGRELSRTKRRDRWFQAGGLRRFLLRAEHGAVILGKAVQGTGRLTAAAVRPVPAAVRDGYAKGRDRHRARAGDRPGGLALDPPWWRPKPKPEQVPDVPEHPAGTAPEQAPEQPEGQVPEQVTGTGPEQVEDTPPARTPFFDDSLDPEGPTLDTEDEIRARHPNLAWISPKPLTIGRRRFWHLRDRGYPGALDQDGWPAPDFHTGAIVNPMPYLDRPARPGDATDEPLKPAPAGPDTDPAAGNSPAATPITPTTEGATVPTPTELRNHVAVQDFAQQIDSLSEASDFVVVAEKARTVGEQSRAGGFGGEMDMATDALEEVAARFAVSVDSLREQAHSLAKTSLSVQGS